MELFKQKCKQWSAEFSSILIPLQKESSRQDSVPDYPIENPIVFNKDLERITKDSNIKLIIIGDNPGKNEQLNKNSRYLCGQSGKIACNFFKNHPELQIDFYNDSIILNKTPVHTAKTKELMLLKKSDSRIEKLIEQSQIWMASQTAALHQKLKIPLWIIGYGEIKDKGLFVPYRDSLLTEYSKSDSGKQFFAENFFVYQHFSMNCFMNDLKKWCSRPENKQKKLQENLNSLGVYHRDITLNLSEKLSNT